MGQEISRVIALFILSWNSFTDVSHHEISLFPTAAGSAFGIAVLFMGSERDIPLPASLLPGICFLIFSFISRGAVGCGDGFVLLALAVCLPLTDLLTTAVCGMFLASAYAGFLLLGGRSGRRSFAFIPFLLGGYVLYLMT